MEFKDVLAISGMPGLYKYVARSNNGIIVESLADGKRMNATATSRVSALTEISMYTEGEDVPLAAVMTSMHDNYNGQQAISHKENPEKLKEAFAKVLPDYDRERVHVSDIKKVFAWYNILNSLGFTEYKLPEEESAE
ncbi:MAG: DUF5606 domain-containing protein [Alistipes sp.]|nr:DUF5606 domain-containing protein [Alistipes sp.]